MQLLNLGNKIENLETSDSFYFAYIKVNEGLKHIFEGKLTPDALNILRKDLDTMKLVDSKFNNRTGIVDFDQLMAYLIVKKRELITEFKDVTLKTIFTMMMREGQKQSEGLDFIQFYTLLKAFEHTKKKKAI